jgi:hypothetical protein
MRERSSSRRCAPWSRHPPGSSSGRPHAGTSGPVRPTGRRSTGSPSAMKNAR